MTVPTALDQLPVIDLFDGEYRADPVAALRATRAGGHWLASIGIGYAVFDYEVVHALVRDPRLRAPGTDLLVMQGVTEGFVFDSFGRSILNIEGDDHHRLRRLVQKAFVPRAIEDLRPHMREVAATLADGIAERGECEFVADFSTPYPTHVICTLLGIADEERERLQAWSVGEGKIFNLNLAEDYDEIEAALRSVYGLIDDLVVARRERPTDDLVSALIAAEDEGDRLDHDELIEMIHTLLFAGFDTTRNQLANGMTLFAEHPEQWERLRHAPKLAPGAVEEMLRLRPTTNGVPRMTTEAIEVRDVTLPAGTLLFLSAAGANTDPTVHANPEEFDIGREQLAPVQTFGGGIHHCLGAALARTEMIEALPILAERIPAFEVTEPLTWKPPVGIYGPERLPLRLTV